MQNQLDSFQFLAIVSVNYAVAMHCTPCQIRYTTKWVKLESIHDKTSFNSSKSYFPPPTSLYSLEEWCWEFWKQSASPNEKVKWHQRTKQEAGSLWNYHWAEGPVKVYLFTIRGFQFVSSVTLDVSSIFYLKRLENTATEKRSSFFVARKIHAILSLLSTLY